MRSDAGTGRSTRWQGHATAATATSITTATAAGPTRRLMQDLQGVDGLHEALDLRRVAKKETRFQFKKD